MLPLITTGFAACTRPKQRVTSNPYIMCTCVDTYSEWDLDNSYPRQCIPRTDNWYPGRLVPRATRTQINQYTGQPVPKTTHTQDNSYPRRISVRLTYSCYLVIFELTQRAITCTKDVQRQVSKTPKTLTLKTSLRPKIRRLGD